MGQYNLVYTVPIKSLRLEKTSEKWQKKNHTLHGWSLRIHVELQHVTRINGSEKTFLEHEIY